ncbi:hypothetical protein AGRA3207_002423 [Actinomadura graeca]|uniref:Uncharacterized protein n=1 Tax=Actinomadura graeca TaxID=2750812 RepID=A0ABX8QRZ6_9ACTN|nr:hypothetical protein [Actinomadura graeca]QXJ21560.1 hypothetical protein AGRA3207_002423 [Actinomadura graeca]
MYATPFAPLSPEPVALALIGGTAFADPDHALTYLESRAAGRPDATSSAVALRR